jgi:carbon storage regulator
MLVLARKIGERILIGEEVEVTIISVRGDQVRIGIAAPAEVNICRAELAHQVRCENAAAARGAWAVREAASAALKPARDAADNDTRVHAPRSVRAIRERRRARQ